MREPGFEQLLAAFASRCEESPFDLVVLRRTDSTNRLVARVGRELEDEDLSPWPTALLAWEQTAGRGRRGRRWDSPPGLGIYASLYLPEVAPERLDLLPLLVAVALADALGRHLPRPCRLKWPNDLLVEGRKVGGILLESSLRSGGQARVVVGFGVNHGQRPEQLPGPGATSLALECDSLPAYADLAWELLTAAWDAASGTGTAAAAIEAYTQRSVHTPGELLSCRVGKQDLRGRFLGFTPEGHLRLATAAGEQRLAAGEVPE